MKYLLQNMSWLQARDLFARENVIALIPIGSHEQHGHHLPMSTDNVIADRAAYAVADLVADEMDVVMCPSVHYGYTMHNMDFPGTMTLRASTLIDFGVDLATSLVHHGCKKVVFVSTHGSNFSVLDLVSREVMNRHPDVLVAIASPMKMAAREIEALREAKATGGMSHACELETSLMLHLDPDNVDMSRAVCDISQPKSDFYFRDMTRGGRGVACADLSRHITRTGAVGDGTLATAEKGKVFFEIIVNTLAQFLREFKERKIEVVAEIDITHATTEIH